MTSNEFKFRSLAHEPGCDPLTEALAELQFQSIVFETLATSRATRTKKDSNK